jgi:multidrug transporter EmrE-like cation transporter
MIISGIGMISAFLWGSIIFQEKINNLQMAIFANIFLVIGVYCVSTSQAKEIMSQEGTYVCGFSYRFR